VSRDEPTPMSERPSTQQSAAELRAVVRETIRQARVAIERAQSEVRRATRIQSTIMLEGAGNPPSDMSATLHEGWAILSFIDGPALAGLLRYERVGTLYQWALDVPPCHHHSGYTAIIDPLRVKAVRPCVEPDAADFMNGPASLREPPAA